MDKIETQVKPVRLPVSLIDRINQKAKEECRSFTGMIRYMAIFYLELTEKKPKAHQ